MRTLSLLFVLAMAANTFAQEPAKPYGKFYGPIANGFGTAKAPAIPPIKDASKLRALRFGLLPPQSFTSTCSVPLLEAQIPDDVHFTIEQRVPAMDKLAPMPHAQTPAPPCESRR
jgi:hypothetical protein